MTNQYIVIAEEGERKLIEEYLPECKDWPVIVTGVGAINIIKSLQNLPKDAELINIGYCGSTNFEIGSTVWVGEARLNHPCVRYEEPTLKLKDEGCICYSNTDFVLQSDYHDCVFDMELAYIAALGFTNLRALKIVSDNLSLHAYHELTNGVI